MKAENKKAFKAVFDRGTIIVLLLCVAVALFLHSGTLASRIIKGETDNVVSSGAIATKLVNVLSDGSEMPEEIYSLLPGQVIDNIVYAKNTGNYQEYVRIKITPVTHDQDGTVLSSDKIHFKFNTTDWTYKDGYYYYNYIVQPHDGSIPLYEEIDIGTDIGNEYRFAKLTVNIELDAVQVANNKTPLEAEGWMQVTSPETSEYE